MTVLKSAPRGLAACAVAALLAVSSHGVAAQEVELRIGTGTPPSHVWTKAAERFAERVAEASDGEIQVDVFPAAQLGPESDQLQQMQTGVLDMGILSAAAVSARAPSFLAWFSPFEIDDVAGAVEASETEAAQAVLGELDTLGIKGMGYVFAGMRHILMADTRVEGVGDLENQKIRITPFPGMQVWWNGAGAVPTPVQLGDVYQALESGLLDGVDIDLDALVGFSMQQVADYLIVTNHMAFPGVAMMTQSAWDGLSDAQKQTVTEVMDETLAWAAEQQIAAEERHMAMLKDEMTVIELADAEQKFSEANAAFQEEFGDMELVEQFQTQVGE
jgi:TRAP-type C4-dicarboxylate transport system substrate-binding protein